MEADSTRTGSDDEAVTRALRSAAEVGVTLDEVRHHLDVVRAALI